MRANMYVPYRNHDLSPLSDDTIRRYAPAVFATKAGRKTSDTYLMVPTFEIMQEMRTLGWHPVEVQQRLHRDPGHELTAAHLLRFAMVKGGKTKKPTMVGDCMPQIIMRNSHDGGVRLEFYQGVFRFVCANGLIVSDREACSPIKASHRAVPALVAMGAISEITSQQAATFDHMNAMRKTLLTDKKQLSLARGALSLLPERAGMLTADSLLVPRRTEDNGNDVWTIYNRLQENLMKGGLEGLTATGRKTKYNGISTIHRQIELNAGLWGLAMDAIGRAAASSKQATRALEAAAEA